MMKYKGCLAVVEFDPDDRILHGRVAGIQDVINLTHPQFGTASSVAATIARNATASVQLSRTSMIRPMVNTLHWLRVLLDQSPLVPVCNATKPRPHNNK